VIRLQVRATGLWSPSTQTEKPKIRAYVNSPLKLRFNSEAARIRINVEYRDEFMADEELMDISSAGVKVPTPPGQMKIQARELGWTVFGCFVPVLLFSSPLFLPSVLPPYLSAFYSKILLTILVRDPIDEDILLFDHFLDRVKVHPAQSFLASIHLPPCDTSASTRGAQCYPFARR
jgi:hypothetical protein